MIIFVGKVEKRTLNKPMEFLYQNVRGLRTKTTKFLCLLQSSSFDFYAITETGCSDSIHDAELIPSMFQVVRCDRTDGRKHGGVLFAAKTRYELRKVMLDIDLNIHTFELVCVTVYFNRNFFFCLLCCVHPSPGG